jgi:hypothetical protein
MMLARDGMVSAAYTMPSRHFGSTCDPGPPPPSPDPPAPPTPPIDPPAPPIDAPPAPPVAVDAPPAPDPLGPAPPGPPPVEDVDDVDDVDVGPEVDDELDPPPWPEDGDPAFEIVPSEHAPRPTVPAMRNCASQTFRIRMRAALFL